MFKWLYSLTFALVFPVLSALAVQTGTGTNQMVNLRVTENIIFGGVSRTNWPAGGSGFPLDADGDLAGFSLTNGAFVGDGSGLTNIAITNYLVNATNNLQLELTGFSNLYLVATNNIAWATNLLNQATNNLKQELQGLSNLYLIETNNVAFATNRLIAATNNLQLELNSLTNTSSIVIGANAVVGVTEGVAIGGAANGSVAGATVGYAANGATYGASLGSYADGATYGAVLGAYANGASYGAALGAYADGATYGAALGYNSHGASNSVAIGNNATGQLYGVGIGYNASSMNGGVAIGSNVVNTEANSTKLYGTLNMAGSPITNASGLQIVGSSPLTGAVWIATDSSGQGKWSSNCAFSVYLSATWNFTNGVDRGPIYFDSENYDYGNNFNTSTYTFTAPVNGIYAFNFRFLTQIVSGSTVGLVEYFIYQNSSILARGYTLDSASGQTPLLSIQYYLTNRTPITCHVSGVNGHTNKIYNVQTYTHFDGALIREIP